MFISESKRYCKHFEGKKGSLVDLPKVIHKPWGTYEMLVDKDKYKIKRMIVKPYSKLSLQKQIHSEKHLLITSGTATVTRENEKILLKEKESIDIKKGQSHRIENNEEEELVIIETLSFDNIQNVIKRDRNNKRKPALR